MSADGRLLVFFLEVCVWQRGGSPLEEWGSQARGADGDPERLPGLLALIGVVLSLTVCRPHGTQQQAVHEVSPGGPHCHVVHPS